jgi:hypothetical protein
MKELLSLKTAVGMLSSAAITATMIAGFELGTTSLPPHYQIPISRAATPVQVNLVDGTGERSCEWVGLDRAERVARCPTIVVTAKRSNPGTLVRAPLQRRFASGEVALSDGKPTMDNKD